jgi:hypothetical protein
MPLAVPAPKTPSDALLYGVEVAWESLFRGGNERADTTQALKIIRIMKAIGATNTRIHLSWAEIEPVRGQHDWRRADALIRLLKSHGFVLTCLVNNTPSWASDSDPALRRLAQELSVSEQASNIRAPSTLSAGNSARVLPPLAAYLPDLGRFAAALGNRYKNSVHRWEFWDHPNELGLPQIRRTGGAYSLTSGDPAVYARLLRTFTANIKRADPTCLVATGEIRTGDPGFLQQLYANGAKDAFDAVSLDLFGIRDTTAFALPDRIHAALLAHGDGRKKIWITSWGWTTYPGMPDGIPEGEQARRIRLLLGAWSRNAAIEMTCLQTLNDWLRTGGDPLSLVSAGLCTRDLQAKPALTAYAVAARHLVVAPDHLHIAGPTAAAPAFVKLSPAHIEIDADDIVGRVPALWRGIQIPTSTHRRLNTPSWQDVGTALVGVNAPMLRIKPLRPSAVTLQADGTPVVAWEDADALLQAASRSGMSAVVALSAPPGLSDSSWSALVTAVVRRYGVGPRYGILRWELDAAESDVARRYPPFAEAIHAILPIAAVGVDLVDDNPLPAARALIAAILKSHTPLDHLGWQMVPAAPDAFVARTVQPLRQLRALLNQHRELRKTSLLPTVGDDFAGTIYRDPSWTAMLAQRLADYAPPDGANGIFGILVSAPLLERSQRPTQAWRALTMVNAVAGARLRTVEDDAGVRCIATRTVSGINLLIWNETASAAPVERYTQVRFRNLPRSAPGGWRLSRRTVALDRPTASSIGRPGSSPYAPPESPTLDADIAAIGDVETPILVSPSTVTLITIRPNRPPTLQVSMDVNHPIVYGGEPLDVLVQLHNPDAKPVRAAVVLVGSHAGLVPTEVSRLNLGALPGGSTKRLRYPLLAPLIGHDGDMGVAVRVSVGPVGTAKSGDEIRQAVIWRALAPLEAQLEPLRVDVGASGTPGTAQLRLSNRSGTPLPLTVHGADSPVALTLAAGRKQVPVRVPVTASGTDPGLYPAVIQIRSRDIPLLDLDALVGVPVPCRRAAAPPTIDGDLADWKDVPSISLGQEDQWHGRPWSGPEDLSAVIYARWDEQNLYLAFAVTQAIFTPPPGAEAWQRYDSVLFALQRAPKQGSSVTEEQYRLALAAGKQPSIMRNNNPSTARAAVRRDGGRTYYELAVPWTELRVTPQPGLMMNFAAVIFHGDGKTSSYMEWGEGLGAEDRPHVFPPLMLEK